MSDVRQRDGAERRRSREAVYSRLLARSLETRNFCRRCAGGRVPAYTTSHACLCASVLCVAACYATLLALPSRVCVCRYTVYVYGSKYTYMMQRCTSVVSCVSTTWRLFGTVRWGCVCPPPLYAADT